MEGSDLGLGFESCWNLWVVFCFTHVVKKRAARFFSSDFYFLNYGLLIVQSGIKRVV